MLGFSLLRFLAGIGQSPESAGKQGESRVHSGLTRFLDRKFYRLFTNITLPIGDTTTQIDHLVVSPYGIFVIETKNMTGWVFGNPDHARWTQVNYQFRLRFQNPLQQNEVHVRAVRNLLRLHPEDVHNVVVFVGDSTFKTPMPPEVVQGVNELANFIKARSVPVFSQFELDRITKRIEESRLKPGARTERTHIRNVEEAISRKASAPEQACPRCGGVLVEKRNRQTGNPFLGCKRYPRCKGTRSLG